MTAQRSKTTGATWKRLACTALFAVTRGAATAAGATAVGAITWWLGNK